MTPKEYLLVVHAGCGILAPLRVSAAGIADGGGSGEPGRAPKALLDELAEPAAILYWMECGSERESA